MKYKLFSILVFLMMFFICNNVKAADFDIPSLSRCANDMQPSNTKDPKVYNLYSDFFYEFDDKRDYAAAALKKMAEQFASEGSACRQFTQPMNRETIRCEKFSGSDVCIIPSDAGEFIIVKDYVDSTNIILTEFDNDYAKFPVIDSDNDSELLWLPNLEQCYDDLRDGLGDSQSYLLDAKPYQNFSDFRFVMARTSRDLVKSLATKSNSCNYQTSAHIASNMQCLKRNNKPSICSISSTSAGYFVYVTDADHGVHLVFNRWD